MRKWFEMLRIGGAVAFVAFGIVGCVSDASIDGVDVAAKHATAAPDGGAGAMNAPDVPGADAGETTPGYVAAPHPALPQVQKGAGQVLAAPKLVAITFPNDALRPQIEEFAATVGATPYWSAIAAEYGVGAASAGAPVHLTAAAPNSVDEAAVKAFVKQGIAGGTFGAFDPSAIYTIFYPASTSVLYGGGTSCVDGSSGYHDAVPLGNGTSAVFAVAARCSSQDHTLIDNLTSLAAHEWIEAATDPVDPTAFYRVADADVAWDRLMAGSEVADLCQYDDGYFTPSGFKFLVQRSWSNAAAKAGRSPCVPAAPGPYFNAAPVLPDTATVEDADRGSITVNAVRIAAGQSKTIELELFSSEPTAEWTLSALDYAGFWLTGDPTLTFSFDKTSGKNGDKVHLTITALGAPAASAPFMVVSTLGAKKNWLVGMVAP